MLEGNLRDIDEWTLRREAWTDQHNMMFDLRWDHYDFAYCYMCEDSNSNIFEGEAARLRINSRYFNEKIYVDGKYI